MIATIPQSETVLNSLFRSGVIVALWDSDLLSETSAEDGRNWLTWGNQGEKEKHVQKERVFWSDRRRRMKRKGKRGVAVSLVADDQPVIILITWQDACRTQRKYFLPLLVGSAAKFPDILPVYGSEENVKFSSGLTFLQTLGSLHVPSRCATREASGVEENRKHLRANMCLNHVV